MSKFDAFLVHLRSKMDSSAFEKATKDPESAQRKVLTTILRTNANTEFGRKHQFSQLKGQGDYSKSVPLQEYEQVEPWVQKMAQGEQRVLTQDTPFMFATTSGTTRNPKLIPVTKTSRASLSRSIRLWLSSILKDYPELFDHGILTVTSPTIEDYTSTGIPMGSMTGLTRARTPNLVRKRYIIPMEVNEITNYDIRYYLLARIAYGTQVSGIITPNPSTVLRIIRVGQAEPARLIEAIHQGTLGLDQAQWDAQSPEQRALLHRIESALSPSPARAGFLETVIRRYGYLSPKGVWPELALIGCWLGGSAGIQAVEMKTHFNPDLAVRDLGFRATEATVSIPIENDTAAGVLALQTNYYEFIRENDIDQERPVTLMAHQLETGEKYYLILTTPGGLYRYDINDVIEVQGWYHKAPKIAFLRKGRDMVNITGEKLHLNQVVDAAQEASKVVNFSWAQLQLIPDTEASTYDLLLEPHEAGVTEEVLMAFLQSFDEHLSKFNIEYKTKRDSRRLLPPRLHEMRLGWSHRKHRNDVMKSGKRDSQYKWPVIQREWDSMTRGDVSRTLTIEQEG